MMKNVMKLNQSQASAQATNAGLDIYGGWGDNLRGQGYLAEAVGEGGVPGGGTFFSECFGIEFAGTAMDDDSHG